MQFNPAFQKAYTKLGYIKTSLKDYEGALNTLSQAIDLDPFDLEAYYNRGMVKNSLKDYEGAISMDPKDAGAYLNRAIFKFKINLIDSGCMDLQFAN